jgi:hypothetical protein
VVTRLTAQERLDDGEVLRLAEAVALLRKVLGE